MTITGDSTRQGNDQRGAERGRYAHADRTYPLPAGWLPADDTTLATAHIQTRVALGLEDSDLSPVLDRLRAYYDPAGNFAGDLLTSIEPNPVDDVTAADLYAVTTLSIDVPALATRRLLHPGPLRTNVHRHLARIPTGLPITALDADNPEVAGVLQIMQDLYTDLRAAMSTETHDSNWWVFAAKLCARKRPSLFPVRDNLVCAYLGAQRSLTRHGVGRFEVDLQVFAWLMTCTDISVELASLRRDLVEQGLGAHLDPDDLRLLDVALWTAAREERNRT